MLVRILTGVVGIPLLLAAIFATAGWSFAIVLAAVCCVIQVELLWNTGIVRCKAIVAVAAVFAAGVPLWVWFDGHGATLVGALALVTVLLFAMGMKGKTDFAAIANVYFSCLAVPLMLSCLVGILTEGCGKYMVLFPFAVAWMSDTGGYFCGRAFGRHKLCPAISPKKTVEGSVGGVIFAALSSLAYCAVLKFVCGAEPAWVWITVIGTVCSPIAQFGDLIFSYIKRQRGIKDFGKLIPGHGGFMDRCDSIITVAPLIWAAMHWLTLVTV